jgi:hypothetical protein
LNGGLIVDATADFEVSEVGAPVRDRDQSGSMLTGIPPDDVHHRVLAQTYVARDEPIGQPVGMHAEYPLSLLV